MRVTIIGAGYVGLVTGVHLASSGHDVTFVEQREDRRESLRQGQMPIDEPGLPEAFAGAVGRINVTADVDSAGVGDVVLIAVGTPIGEGGRSDLRGLDSAIRALRGYPDAHVCVRSTLPPGLSRRLPDLLGRRDGRRISTIPEFLRQGEALWDVRHPSRVVIGVFPEVEQEHLDRIGELYREVDAPRLTVDVTAAELIKNVANAFLALKLSFVNEVASLSEEYDVDVEEVLAGIGLDPRIGTTYMRPSVGFGGSCLPKELEVVAGAGRLQGLPMHLARAVSLVNDEQQSRFVRRIRRELGAGPHRIALLGLSFKANTDDLRGSPSVRIAHELLDAGLTVVAHDPVVRPAAAMAEAPGIVLVTDPMDAIRDADAIVIGTEWEAYRVLDWATARALVGRPVVFDGRNLLDRAHMVELGFHYRGVGRRSAEPEPSATTESLIA